MFERLKESGYELGVATGRARIEMEVPFKTYGWDEEFESNYLATASDAVDESKMYGGSVPDKPHPFIYLCAAYGRNKENYPAYMAGTIARGSEDEIYVCGDSFSDLLGSRAAGFRFIGVLYGAEKDKTASLLKKKAFLTCRTYSKSRIYYPESDMHSGRSANFCSHSSCMVELKCIT